MNLTRFAIWIGLGMAIALPAPLDEERRTESFDRDPGWDGYQNRLGAKGRREVKQDFGYDAAERRIGGLMTPSWETAYYARKIPTRTFSDRLRASGTLTCTGRKFHTLIAFFNADTLGAWRTENTVALRIMGRGDHFYAYVEYCTGKWRAGGDSPQGFSVKDPATGRSEFRHFPLNTPIKWSIDYDPAANNGGGAVTIQLGDATGICHLGEGHKADGATFNRFGLLNVMKSVDDAGEVWLDDVTIEGQREDFSRDPGWDAVGNRRTFTTTRIRPWFDFGYSPTRFAGGKGRGELGGVAFRGDSRYADKMGYYGARTEPLDMTKPIHASGRIALLRAASDSTTIIGFFSSQQSATVQNDQKSSWPNPFLGIAVEGPSPDGFYVYPAYRSTTHDYTNSHGQNPPHIYPDGKSHTWSLRYTPGHFGRIEVTLDGHTVGLNVDPAHQRSGAKFDRFGIISTAIDGNGQLIYFDDLTFTVKQ